MAECEGWDRVHSRDPKDMDANANIALLLLQIKKRRGIRPYVEQARQNWLQRRRVVPLRAQKVRERELIAQEACKPPLIRAAFCVYAPEKT
ncbi:hypothetical protein Gain_0027_005 [Komagataeibacter intermedius TF2]|uniref:Transposase n=2 Tax=Komagataeibacter intermedius TaxID=66229 RepID=A0ABQ0PGK8_9PROT|nr:hypothetical protein Gain_0027_005 [Komagataeibacter intermedius TF2]GBQ67858.1 hypothetical protein AA0521_1088 [Komagataeibacter intermedius NRIC 0521]